MTASEEMIPVFVGTTACRGALFVLMLLLLEGHQIVDPFDHEEGGKEG
jgi:hypothetical protein